MSSQPPPLPRTLEIEVTTRCNLSCTFCQHTYWSRPKLDMPWHLYDEIVNGTPTLRSLKLHGIGEPFLNNEIFSMVERAKQKGLFTWTYTNGSPLQTAKAARAVVGSGLDLLRISVDGGSKETYEAIRIGARWENLVSSIEALVTARHTLGSSLRIELWMVATTGNFLEVKPLIQFGANMGIDAVRVQLRANTYDHHKEVAGSLSGILLTDYDDDFVRQAYDLAEACSIEFTLERGKQCSADRICPWPFERGFVSAEGFLLPCSTIGDPREINFGSVAEEGFETVWKSPEFMEFRRSHLERRPPKYCLGCYGAV